MAIYHVEGGAGVADGDGQEFRVTPYPFEGINEWGVIGGLLSKPFVTSEVLAETDLDEDEVALLAVDIARVRRRNVGHFSGVDEVGGGSVSRLE